MKLWLLLLFLLILYIRCLNYLFSKPKPPNKRIIVVGTESSGTRFVSRLIASMYHKYGWNGEYPSCVHFNETISLEHISIPFGFTCSRFSLRNILGHEFTTCDEHPTVRVFLNVSDVLVHDKDAFVIVVTRKYLDSLNSIYKNHCKNKILASRELRLARQLLQDAIELNSNRLLMVDYESLEDYFHYNVEKIKDFLAIDWQVNEQNMERFKSKIIY
jgi:hypothetical protein